MTQPERLTAAGCDSGNVRSAIEGKAELSEYRFDFRFVPCVDGSLLAIPTIARCRLPRGPNGQASGPSIAAPTF